MSRGPAASGALKWLMDASKSCGTILLVGDAPGAETSAVVTAKLQALSNAMHKSPDRVRYQTKSDAVRHGIQEWAEAHGVRDSMVESSKPVWRHTKESARALLEGVNVIITMGTNEQPYDLYSAAKLAKKAKDSISVHRLRFDDQVQKIL